MVLLTITQYGNVVADQDVPEINKFIAGLIFILGAPVFCAYTALSGLLDYLLPEDWNNDDDDDDKYQR